MKRFSPDVRYYESDGMEMNPYGKRLCDAFEALEAIKVWGDFDLKCWNNDGSLAWHRAFRNGITNAGLDYLGASALSGGSVLTTWYAGLIDLNGFTALNVLDTMASHAGWKENTQYSGTRPQWVNAEGGQQVASNGPFTFPITGNGTIHGMFICSNNVAGGNGGTLWSTAILPSDATISTGQSLTGTYNVTFGAG